jgi:MinD-like ATPase involved in chromosome partitioning or flagellar assembly
MRYVMNRANSSAGLKTREVEAGLKVKISTELPLDKVVQVSVNRGEPAILSEPRSDFSKALAALARDVAPAAPKTGAAANAKRRHRLSFARA